MKKIIPWLIAGLTFSLSGGANAALFDRGGGLIYDDVLNVTWLQDANYAKTSSYDADGWMTWQDSMNWAANLSYYDGERDVTYDDWRLPTVQPIGISFNYNFSFNGTTDNGYHITSPNSEMSYMYYINLDNLGRCTPNGSCSPQSTFSLIDDPNNPNDESLFANLQSYSYWSGTEFAPNSPGAWNFDMVDGVQFGGPGNGKSSPQYAWAVRDGDIAAIPEPETYAMMLAGLGLVGAMARRRKQAEI